MTSPEKIWLVIPCAGKGRRFGSDIPKQYLPFAGQTVIQTTLSRFLCRDDVAGIVLVVAEDDDWIRETVTDPRVYFAVGGQERVHSVLNGLQYLADQGVNEQTLVAVHDAARPCVRQSSLNALFPSAAESDNGALLAKPVADTVKLAGSEGRVDKTIDRSQLHLAHTPQVFRLGLLKEAISHALEKNLIVTDDASAMELADYSPVLVEDASDNIKITRATDLALAEYFYQKITEECD